MAQKTEKVWKVKASKHWPESQLRVELGVGWFDDQDAKAKKSFVELTLNVASSDYKVVMNKDAKRVAFVEWLKELSKAAGEAAGMLEGLRVED